MSDFRPFGKALMRSNARGVLVEYSGKKALAAARKLCREAKTDERGRELKIVELFYYDDERKQRT